MKEVFIIGSKGIPAQYGGFETFVERLTEKKRSKDLLYHVACMSDSEDEFTHNGARCFNVKVPDIGAAKAVYYDIAALKKCITYIRENRVEDAVVYILACRIGPFIGHYKKILNELGAHVYVNPDGHEWKRAKWNRFIRKYWKVSERLMVKHAELLICDSINIEKYIKDDYSMYSPKTTYIAYGADVCESSYDRNTDVVRKWYDSRKVKEGEYYLIVGRFVPENNYEIMIREFMKSNTKKDLVIVTNVTRNKFYAELNEKTNFKKDKRIKFVGTVYNQELLSYIRRNAYGYLHGHEVGGTNPSLLEALATTPVNLLLNVGFNKEVGQEGAIYWGKEYGSLEKLVNECDSLKKDKIKKLEIKAKERISNNYDWHIIVEKYERLFLN